MEWAGNGNDIMVMQLNRLQKEATFYLYNPTTGAANKTYMDKDDAWVDVHEWLGPTVANRFYEAAEKTAGCTFTKYQKTE